MFNDWFAKMSSRPANSHLKLGQHDLKILFSHGYFCSMWLYDVYAKTSLSNTVIYFMGPNDDRRQNNDNDISSADWILHSAALEK